MLHPGEGSLNGLANTGFFWTTALQRKSPQICAPIRSADKYGDLFDHVATATQSSESTQS